MNKYVGLAILAIIVVCMAVGFVVLRRDIPNPQPQLSQPIVAPKAPVAQIKPITHYPIEAATESEHSSKPLPSLQDSDHVLLDALSHLLGRKAVDSIVLPEALVRHLVATIDNLPRERIAVQLLPVMPVSGEFLVDAAEQSIYISPKNYERYALYMRIARNLDAKKLVALYVRLYPLFQEAYEDLGYPTGYFNDRLIEVIDHLLDGPETRDPVRLVQPHVFYKYSDQGLEAMSAGHKIMRRIGGENATILKGKLREIRRELTKNMATITSKK